jgi:DNA repair protein RadC
MSQHIFQLESELQNIPEAAPKASPSFSVSEKLARYGSTALSALEHLTLLVGKESIAFSLMRHFGSLKALSRASFLELRQFLPQQKAEAVIAALSMSAIAETEHALSDQLDNPESVYHACADMKLLNQEVLRVILLDTLSELPVLGSQEVLGMLLAIFGFPIVTAQEAFNNDLLGFLSQGSEVFA